MTLPTPKHEQMMSELDSSLTELLEQTLLRMDAAGDIDDSTALAILMSVMGRLSAQIAIAFGLPQSDYIESMTECYHAANSCVQTLDAINKASKP